MPLLLVLEVWGKQLPLSVHLISRFEVVISCHFVFVPFSTLHIQPGWSNLRYHVCYRVDTL